MWNGLLAFRSWWAGGGFEIGVGGTLDNKLADRSFGSRVEIGSGKGVKTLSGFGRLKFPERL